MLMGQRLPARCIQGTSMVAVESEERAIVETAPSPGQPNPVPWKSGMSPGSCYSGPFSSASELNL